MNSRPKPNLGAAVERLSETMISFTMKLRQGISRKDAARFVINSNPGWFLQTPEGEYLDWVVHCEDATKESGL